MSDKIKFTIREATQEDVDFLKGKIRQSDIDEVWARKMAIEIFENACADVWEAGSLGELQKKIASEEATDVIKGLVNIKDEY